MLHLKNKRRKRGSYRCKHRNDVSRWHIVATENAQRRRRQTPLSATDVLDG